MYSLPPQDTRVIGVPELDEVVMGLDRIGVVGV